MPYSSNTELPDDVKRVLPDSAQAVWRHVFNSAWETYNGDEGRCAATAWAVVKRQFKKTPEGKWISRSEAKLLVRQEATTMRTIANLSEGISISPDCRIDRPNGVIHGVSVVGEKSAHGYDLTSRWHESAVPKLENAKVCVNHPDWYIRRERPLPTKAQELAGRLRSVRFESQRMRTVGDLHLIKGPNREMILDQVESDPTAVGLSILHDSQAMKINGRESLVLCDAIHRVDYVVDPATTNGMFESVNPDKENDEMKIEELTLEELRKARPDLLEAVVAETRDTDQLTAEHKALLAEHAKAKTELAGFKEAEAKRLKVEMVTKILAEAKLSEAAAKEILPVLESCESKERMEAIVKAIKGAHEAQTLKSQERASGSDGAGIDVKTAWNGTMSSAGAGGSEKAKA